MIALGFLVVFGYFVPMLRDWNRCRIAFKKYHKELEADVDTLMANYEKICRSNGKIPIDNPTIKRLMNHIYLMKK